jgi:murein DD-endopeptidase MepM/ murein hydrolase activator NlpD
LHALPPSPVRRRHAVPGCLLGIAVLALAGLAVLPPSAPTADPLLTRAASPRFTVRTPSVEPMRAQVVRRPSELTAKPSPKTSPKSAAGLRPAQRVSRSRPGAVAGPSGYVCPVPGRRSFSDDWGDARSNGRRHQGNDILAPYGAPVVAVTAGVVSTAYSSAGGISLYLHGTDGDEYFYAHNSKNLARDGERVAAGEVIALVGTTGNARGGPPHVHFERHPGGGAAVDPYRFLVGACR